MAFLALNEIYGSNHLYSSDNNNQDPNTELLNDLVVICLHRQFHSGNPTKNQQTYFVSFSITRLNNFATPSLPLLPSVLFVVAVCINSSNLLPSKHQLLKKSITLFSCHHPLYVISIQSQLYLLEIPCKYIYTMQSQRQQSH